MRWWVVIVIVVVVVVIIVVVVVDVDVGVDEHNAEVETYKSWSRVISLELT